MNYSQVLNLLSQRGNEVRGIHLGLHRIAAIMHALGNPHEGYAVLHIAGTNGKGSVAAMSEAILRAAGWKTGLYTSPHLEKLEERIRVSGRNIPARTFTRLAIQVFKTEEELWSRNELDMRLTYFEFLTACAFLHFAMEKVDVAVIEVGLGGRLDATNIVNPQACIITGISFDHQNLLGSTLAEIAAEKAGIIKAGVPVISGCRVPEAKRVIRAKARRATASLMEIDRDCRVHVVGERGSSVTVDLRTPRHHYRRLPLALAGLHQARNAALAVAGAEALDAFPVRIADVKHGLASTHWPGRLDEYFAGRRTLLEGAHNAEGARALRNHLLRCEDSEIHLVFGVLGDKDIPTIGRLLFPLAESIHLTPVANSRSAQPADIAAAHSRFRSRMRAYGNAPAALRAAWDVCPRNGLVVVTGSLYLVGELLPLVRSRAK
ncbi:MAG: bifunctional folylpolyglutamate synthase/dihydrofolate synthase [Acidobacteriia bacterium]|nr:bifunctional folylpolyglutamate synthase/dihydrofolate synthase [Terriglobia bacterium]